MPTTERKPVAEMTDDEINAELDDRLGVDRAARTEDIFQVTAEWLSKQPVSVINAYNRGDKIPDLFAYVDAWRKPATPYCSSWERAIALGEEMERHGLPEEYVEALADITVPPRWPHAIWHIFGDKKWLNTSQISHVANATQRQRAMAALMALREAQDAR